MFTNVRGLSRPRHGYRKPRGIPQVIQQFAPRGLMICAPLNDPGFRLAKLNRAVSVGSPAINDGAHLVGTPYGLGLGLAGNHECVSYALTSGQPPTAFSMEILLYESNPTATGTFCGWNGAANGAGTEFDRSFITTDALPGLLQFFTYDGASKTAGPSIGTYPTGLHHFVGTADGTTMRLYRNGAQTNTQAAGAAFTSYTTPFFCIGSTGRGITTGDVTFASAQILLVNFADVTWTPAEVLERYLNPFGFLSWPEDRVYSNVSGAPPILAPRGWFDPELISPRAWFG
jgi:hypothetical protein